MEELIARRLVFPLQEFVKGKSTLRELRTLERTQWLSSEALHELQFERLKQHLQFAYEHVPHYRKLFEEQSITPDRIRSLSDFRRIPFLTREGLRSDFTRLQANIRIAGIQKISTGGSSGSPVTILSDSRRNLFIDAARLRAHRWFDADVGVREIVLWGSPIEITRQDYLRRIRDRFLNTRLLSAFNLGESNLRAYSEEIVRFGPRKMYGYASALYVLALHFRKTNVRPPPMLKVIFATAEPLFDFQRRTIQEVFGVKVAVEYGARDAGLIANECPAGALHIPAEGMLVEIVPGPDEPAGEVLVTNLESRAMPLVRYRTGDIAECSREPCSCGRALPVLKAVQGRQTDFLLTRDGRLIHALAVIYVLREMAEIKQFQIVQESLTKLIVRVVPQTDWRTETELRITRELRRVLDSELEIDVVCCDEIASSPSGKFRYVISNVAKSYFESALEVSSQ